ncbi:proteasome-interacting protein cic1 [Friedmanniomyces endolithicus]|uniref:Proteasome-interacting protein cic1 n=1 Tax=Rachicladosporium monterosium TaxID=1507873 RepID=A0ABR0L407_9PEZI|nr:proteasome-interacting protein cic1 [Friedmanniomyces endolithicus]KAK5143192.1 proteasome-interacting protein cic1 [Rachicladosporium monterosium]
MAPVETALATRTPVQSKLDPAQTLRATTALLSKIQSDEVARKTTATNTTPAATKPQSLLADADGEPDAENDLPIWLVLTTKKHIVDAKRLKPGKILLPHPYLSTTQEPALRICLITADPQRKYKDLVEDHAFPAELKKRITRVLGIEKVKARYKSFESRRQLLGEYDIFLADDRVITYLPHLLGKVFYKGGSKRPIPENVEVVVDGLVGKWVAGGWKGLRSVHVKGPNTAALPIWMAGELWGDEGDVLEEAPVKSEKKRKRSALGEGAGEMAVIEVPGPDGKMRRLEAPGAKANAIKGDEAMAKPAKKPKSDVVDDDGAAVKAVEKSEMKARKEALAQQKEEAKKAVAAVMEPEVATSANGDGKKAVAKKARMKAADVI